MAQWWVEGGERVWVGDGRLQVRADTAGTPGHGVATVWHRVPHLASFRLTVEAHVVSSSLDVNNINLFFSYRDPAGRPLHETRDLRRNAEYRHYHALEGYIITFLNDAAAEGGRDAEGKTRARVRIRRNPGFHLLAETFAASCRQGVTYRIEVTKHGGDIVFRVDGVELLRARDPQPLAGGLLGLRTFRTHLWWDNLRIEPL